MSGDIGKISEEIIDYYAYVSISYTEPHNLIASDKKRFLADRYGSRYQICAGGSSRCGINGNFQIKGIGKNPLISDKCDYNHAHGKLCLTEAINEAIWGEVCHQALPHGAVRTLAIIKTEILVRSDYALGEEMMQPCALAIREPAVRPAHFERATFFWPETEHMHLRDNDYIRVQRAYANMANAFGVTEEDREIYPENDAFCAIRRFIIKMATQIGISRIAGIPHGSLTSSNISVDGRFLDFGTMTAVPDFANYITAAGQGGVWDDHILIAEWLRHLYFYVNKYSQTKLSQEMQDILIELFFRELEDSENKSCAKILGFSSLNKKEIEIGARLKQRLRSRNRDPRPFIGFGTASFSNDLEAAIREENIVGAQIINSYFRRPSYSQHTIAMKTADLLGRAALSSYNITELIDGYIEEHIR